MPDSMDSDAFDLLGAVSAERAPRWVRVRLAGDDLDGKALGVQVFAELGEELAGGFGVGEVGTVEEEDKQGGKAEMLKS